jgi:hypothetical protein
MGLQPTDTVSAASPKTRSTQGRTSIAAELQWQIDIATLAGIGVVRLLHVYVRGAPLFRFRSTSMFFALAWRAWQTFPAWPSMRISPPDPSWINPCPTRRWRTSKPPKSFQPWNWSRLLKARRRIVASMSLS